MTTSNPDDYLPLKPVVLQILLALADSELHGYGVVQAIERQSQGRVRVEAGPLYRHLKALLDQELVRESPHRPPDADARRGTYYRLTTLGREVLVAEAQRLSSLVEMAGAIGLLKSKPRP